MLNLKNILKNSHWGAIQRLISLKKFFYLLFISMILLNSGLFALEVDVDELKSTQKVEFKNYTGKHKKVNLVREIKGIGRYLAKEIIKKGANKPAVYFKKYSMVHAVSSKEPDKLPADIFSIYKKANVGHIKNVRRIIAGYLETMYDYSKKQAHTLAVFLSYYNAVYKGDIDYFSTKYKSTVLQYINKKYAGMSLNYDEWSGNTKILIPLTEESKRGDLDKIDLYTISDKKVKETVRKDDENIDERKDMIEIKEEVIEKDKKEIEEKKTALKEEKEKLKEIEDEIQQETEEEKIAEKEEILKKEKEKIAEKEEILKEEEEEIAEKEEELKEEKMEIKEDELKKKEKELARREEMLRTEKVDKNIFADNLYYLKVSKHMGNGHYNNEMYKINALNHEIESISQERNICGTKYDIFADGVMVITYLSNHYSPHRLTLLNLESLKVIKYAKEKIFWRSFILINDGFVYVILKGNEEYYLGKLDGNLDLAAKSKEKIHGDTFISFYENHLYINRWDNNILVLNKDDLSLIDLIEPGVEQ